MADTLHRDALPEDGFHEIQLSGKQLVFLFMTGATLAVLIFLCGVQVGRNAKGDRLVATDTADATASAAAPPPASTPVIAAAASGPPAAEPPAPPQDDELSYAKRLQASDPAAGDKVAAAPAPAPAPVPADTKPVPTKQAAAPPPPKTAAEPAGSGRPGAWIVQLSANKDRGQAVSAARALAAKGYPAFVLDPAPNAPPIYRVQVGGYPNRDAADQVARKLEKEEHYKPYVRSR